MSNLNGYRACFGARASKLASTSSPEHGDNLLATSVINALIARSVCMLKQQNPPAQLDIPSDCNGVHKLPLIDDHELKDCIWDGYLSKDGDSSARIISITELKTTSNQTTSYLHVEGPHEGPRQLQRQHNNFSFSPSSSLIVTNARQTTPSAPLITPPPTTAPLTPMASTPLDGDDGSYFYTLHIATNDKWMQMIPKFYLYFVPIGNEAIHGKNQANICKGVERR